MKIITKYIIKELISPLFFGLFSFTSIFLGYLFIDLMDEVEQFHIPISYVIKMVSLRIPEYVVAAAPVAVLFAALLGLGKLTSHSETVAMRASGLSFAKLAIPTLILGTAVSLCSLTMNEFLVPFSLQTYDRFKSEAGSRKAEGLIRNFTKDFYFQDRLQKLVYASSYDPKRRELAKVVIQEFDNARLNKTIEAETMFWDGQGWFFKKGRIYQYANNNFYPIIVDQGQIQDYDLGMTPTEIVQSNLEPDRQSISQLTKYIEKFVASGEERTKLLVDLHTKFAIPFASLVMAILGTPLALRPQRRSNAAGFGLSIIFIFIWYVLMGVGTSMGHSGVLTPFLAAWLPNLVLAGYGVSVFIKVKS